MLLTGCMKCDVRTKPSMKSRKHGKSINFLTLEGQSKCNVRMKQSIKIGEGMIKCLHCPSV